MSRGYTPIEIDTITNSLRAGESIKTIARNVNRPVGGVAIQVRRLLKSIQISQEQLRDYKPQMTEASKQYHENLFKQYGPAVFPIPRDLRDAALDADLPPEFVAAQFIYDSFFEKDPQLKDHGYGVVFTNLTLHSKSLYVIVQPGCGARLVNRSRVRIDAERINEEIWVDSDFKEKINKESLEQRVRTSKLKSWCLKLAE